MIYVTNLLAMPAHVRALRPARLVSIVQPEFQPATPPEIPPGRHYRVEVHDVASPFDGPDAPAHEHVEGMIDFLRGADLAEGVLVHCFAGISRSTAAALIARVVHGGPGSELEAAQALRRAAPHAHPNPLIVELADEILGAGGRLIAAREAMGEGVFAESGPLVELSLGERG